MKRRKPEDNDPGGEKLNIFIIVALNVHGQNAPRVKMEDLTQDDKEAIAKKMSAAVRGHFFERAQNVKKVRKSQQ